MSTCVSSQWLLEASSIFISQSVQSVLDLLPCDSIKIRLQPTPSCSCELDRYKRKKNRWIVIWDSYNVYELTDCPVHALRVAEDTNKTLDQDIILDRKYSTMISFANTLPFLHLFSSF